jgi:hypothetical protein
MFLHVTSIAARCMESTSELIVLRWQICIATHHAPV